MVQVRRRSANEARRCKAAPDSLVQLGQVWLGAADHDARADRSWATMGPDAGAPSLRERGARPDRDLHRLPAASCRRRSALEDAVSLDLPAGFAEPC